MIYPYTTAQAAKQLQRSYVDPTKDIPYLDLTGELWGVYFAYFGVREWASD